MNADTRLKHDVLAEPEWAPGLDASQIGVSARDGVVTLTGYVPSYAEKLAAERAAKRVFGVQAVADDVEVKIPGGRERSDTDIATAALNAMKWDSTLPEDRIKVTVRHGWISLEGALEWWYKKEGAQRAVQNLTGVKGVTNKITVKAPLRPGEVKDQIEAAFRRSAEMDARRVNVEASDGKVVLRGTVHSWAEKRAAERAAWAAPGVCEVETHLTVTP